MQTDSSVVSPTAVTQAHSISADESVTSQHLRFLVHILAAVEQQGTPEMVPKARLVISDILVYRGWDTLPGGGGGGGGGGAAGSDKLNVTCQCGGGVGLFGKGADGMGGIVNGRLPSGGSGGIHGSPELPGRFGGGGCGLVSFVFNGACRVVWGEGRAFPDTDVGPD